MLEEGVEEFQVVVEGNKSDLQKGNLEINALVAQLAVGSRVASRSADCSACDFQTAVDRSAHLELNPLKPELNPICYLLALLAHHFLHVSRIRAKSLTLR